MQKTKKKKFIKFFFNNIKNLFIDVRQSLILSFIYFLSAIYFGFTRYANFDAYSFNVFQMASLLLLCCFIWLLICLRWKDLFIIFFAVYTVGKYFHSDVSNIVVREGFNFFQKELINDPSKCLSEKYNNGIDLLSYCFRTYSKEQGVDRDVFYDSGHEIPLNNNKRLCSWKTAWVKFANNSNSSLLYNMDAPSLAPVLQLYSVDLGRGFYQLEYNEEQPLYKDNFHTSCVKDR
ncbi:MULTISPECIES: hypothetical protein [Pantoea]|uniref:hypothetical protein n=1 Tax=Pantoea TaxID=53335 RepID=UPI000ACE8113|nr:hypothetical protein [Pantoea ananatis]